MVSGYERSKAAPGKPHEGRLPIPAHLRRAEKVLEPAEDTTQMEHIGDEVSETLEYTPGELWVRVLYAANTCARIPERIKAIRLS
ncbi:MAG: hypothetical protein IPL65_15385 [Lewinellaceae bacterium]|nr:hypothetical protein [Lewinellaceae bacterium]